MLASPVVAVEASGAAKGRETDPRRLASEVGPGETGRCGSGAGGPGLQQNPPRPRDGLVRDLKTINAGNAAAGDTSIQSGCRT